VTSLSADDDALISTFGRLVEVQGRLERRLGSDLEGRFGLPHAWFEVLIRLSRSKGGQLTMGALAGQVTLTTGGVTRLIDRMESAGLVERLPCRTDRRVSYAAITGAGRAKLAQAAEVHAANLRTVFEGFSANDLATFDELLDRLRGTTPDRATPHL
jgi:MarR family transcriptional regulator, 2-MHQ and catechol-resistance regulon repressor